MYVLSLCVVLLFFFATPTWTLPSLPVDESPPTVYNPDGTPKGSKSKPSSSQMDKGIKWKGPQEKYFHESTFDAHYDGRFASITQPPSVRNQYLRALIRTYLATMHDLKMDTWIMHGTLLGWWWNGRIMPWDSDLDVQVTEHALSHLAAHHNMTVFSFRDAEYLDSVDMGDHDVGGNDANVEGRKRQYLLDINPRWRNASYADTHNVIDARWIDMKTGLYIDITSVRLNTSSPVPGSLYCKDHHRYLGWQIFPLRTSTFEGVPAKVPYAYQELLTEEYGGASLVDSVYREEKYRFDAERMEWVSMNRRDGDDGKFHQFGKVTEKRLEAKDSEWPSAKRITLNERRNVMIPGGRLGDCLWVRDLVLARRL
ncbi:hypothetical protein BU23DRAFT_549569 [Bimuria novae-zelandiae CBS 107.79]|uniref:LicD/FKTN/FKRP nucleotidyltransferase domain-containing protein n=1 Tax=Bimuria novae-zelandiae CBS 107.79 TaxID=1447943 RepID=A0A6A5VNG0_9PLEO|nr:hypothetical protein BU23DRAFT_549569 [Bimuria novae-zelandiae CBS 107.79]